MSIKKSVKACLRKLPGFKKLMHYFDETGRLSAALWEAQERIALEKNRADILEKRIDLLMMHVDQLYMHVMSENDAAAPAKACAAEMKEREEHGKRPRMAVYTVLTGEYDTFHAPTYVDPYCDYYCITNNRNLKSSFWKIIYMDNEAGFDNIRFQRKLKISPHILFPEYEHSLYVDAAVLIHKSVWDWIDRFSTGKSLLAYLHPDRDCIYEEGAACIKLGKDSSDLINEQLSRYRQMGYPENNGLVWSAILYRKHRDPDVIKVHETWLDEINRGSRRDQLSFNYSCWKNGFEYDEATGDYRDYFLWAYSHDGKYW